MAAAVKPAGLSVSSSLALSLASSLAFLVFWQIVAQRYFVPALLPAPSVVWTTLVDYARTGAFLIDVLVSAQRVLVGFVGGSLLGVALGFALGGNATIRRAFEPTVQVFRFIPPIAWLTPALIWFGIGEGGKYFLIIYTTAMMVMLGAMSGVQSVATNKIRAAQCFGAGRLATFLHVQVPAAMPQILTGMRVGLGNAFQTLVIAEMLAANHGIGHLIMSSRTQLSTELVFVGIACIGVGGLLLDLLFRAVVRRVAWRFVPA